MPVNEEKWEKSVFFRKNEMEGSNTIGAVGANQELDLAKARWHKGTKAQRVLDAGYWILDAGEFNYG